MARMADQVFYLPYMLPVWVPPADQSPEIVAHHRDTLREDLRESLIFIIDNVAEYLFEGTDQEDWDVLHDFPSVAPPAARFWMEWKMPKRIVSRKFGVTELNDTTEMCGMQFFAEEITSLDVETQAAMRVRYGDRFNQGCWVLGCRLYLLGPSANRRFIVGPLSMWQILVDGKGKPLERDFWLVGMRPGTMVGDRTVQDVVNAMSPNVFAPLLALSFLSCRNVSRVENTPPERLSRSHAKKHGHFLTKFYTLEIDPMREVLRREGKADQVGLQRSLHVCRGHFAHYTDEKPLFGRVTGTVWRPMHVRGSIKQGVIAKDYAVKSKTAGGGSR